MKTQKKYQLGDLWSKDFDYDGMLEVAATVKLSWGEEKLQKLYDSFEDVNYHEIGGYLYGTIDFLKSGDRKAARKELSDFKLIVKNQIYNKAWRK